MSFTHNPGAGLIGTQLVGMSTEALGTGLTAAASVIAGLIPAGCDEISAQATAAFGQMATSMLEANAAAQQEIMRAGAALTDIARMYGTADEAGAQALQASGAMFRPTAEAITGLGGFSEGVTAIQAQLAEAAPQAAKVVQAAVPIASGVTNASSMVMGGISPLMSMGGTGGAAAGTAAGLTSSTAPVEETAGDDTDDEQAAPDEGERLL